MESWLAILLIWLGVMALLRELSRRFRRRPTAKPDRSDLPYHVYTTAFDRTLPGHAVKAALIEAGAWLENSSWSVGTPEEQQAIAVEAFGRARESDGAAKLGMSLDGCGGRLAICILVDRSGSMRNQIASLSGQLRALAEICDAAGVALAIYGYTTFGWRGGAAREAWIKAGRPAYPGRLCALLHTIDKDFGESLTDERWIAMRDPGTLFENIDGEALLWAETRLAARPESERLLIAVSDGAPVDDSTLTENGAGFLERHILDVIPEITSRGAVALGAIGVGFAVDRYYPESEKVLNVNNILSGIGDLIDKLRNR